MLTTRCTVFWKESYEVRFVYNLYLFEPFFADVLWLLLFVEAFIKIMKPSVSIHEAVSAHLRHFQLCFFIDRIRSIQGRKWNELQNRIETLASCLNVSIFSYLMKIMWGKRQWNHSWKHVPQSNDIADFSNISLTSVIGSLWSLWVFHNSNKSKLSTLIKKIHKFNCSTCCLCPICIATNGTTSLLNENL